MQQLIRKHANLFHLADEDLTETNAVKHTIELTDNIPVRTKIYRYPPCHRDEIKRQITDMLHQGIIRPSNSPYASPLWVVEKKDGPGGVKRWRLVINYRALNEKTVGNSYPLPNITEILDSL